MLNSLLVPLLDAAQKLYANGVSDPETVDLAWRLGTGAAYGPFRILDVIGLITAYNVVMLKPEAKAEGTEAYRVAQMLKKYIDEGKLGVNAGEGFYKYS